MVRAPAYQWYPKDAAVDEKYSVMSLEEKGAYHVLLDHQWMNGSIPSDPTLLAKILKAPLSRVKKLMPAILTAFRPQGRSRRLVNNRMLREKKRLNILRTDKSQAGIRSARLRAARKKGTHNQAEWGIMLSIVGPNCPRCGQKSPLVRDHVQPLYQGGNDSIKNLQPLCRSCISSKGPETIDYIEDLRGEILNTCSTAVGTPVQQMYQQKGNTASCKLQAASANRLTPQTPLKSQPLNLDLDPTAWVMESAEGLLGLTVRIGIAEKWASFLLVEADSIGKGNGEGPKEFIWDFFQAVKQKKPRAPTPYINKVVEDAANFVNLAEKDKPRSSEQRLAEMEELERRTKQ
jgi:5-methylcytosine-specific restriction endonuclease McrA